MNFTATEAYTLQGSQKLSIYRNAFNSETLSSKRHAQLKNVPFDSIIALEHTLPTEHVDVRFIDVDGYKDVATLNFYTTNEAWRFMDSMFNTLKSKGYTSRKRKLGVFFAALLPLVVTLIIAAVGGASTWTAYQLMHDLGRKPSTDEVAIFFDKIFAYTGWLPLAIGTGVLVLLCLVWLVRRMVKRPKIRIIHK